ncbi:gamma-glutamyl-gamma-aminobutyrate hydrolase family protein [Nocardioides sp. BP30]|uniref:type 1 glutamine amidotransferase n=1 Tax=Nocardioides sp. BP30 TaxID=3036374 RepID=UPI002468DB66|nr:gamma-glutamyl-gamma-aminobutyrate hydrolase family protein [Nocardioides sp. BP30]WGL51937.1 gamma-glutamyl-gamma-aminobutyrate hydrolase family protein [Nocardioides sp. BP30]
MRALVVAHDHVSPVGPIGDQLERRGYRLEHFVVVGAEQYATPAVTTAFPDFASYDAVVVLGAPWSVYDDATIGTWVHDEIKQVQAADAAGVPVLGICFGGQLLAQAHGGSVQRAQRPEIGWADVASTDEELVASGPWFQWHFDRWTTPPEARPVASNAAAPQSFVLRRNLAVQFHPELTPSSLAGWLDNGGDAGARAAGFDPERLVQETELLAARNEQRAAALVDAFLDRVATA